MVTFFCLVALISMGCSVALLYIWVLGNEPKTINPDIIVIKTTLKHPWGRRMIAGGQARLALWCHLNGIKIPSTYTPRDIDYVKVANNSSSRKGIIYSLGSDDVDELTISSISEYFERVDLVTNQVLLEGNTIYTTQEAINCFKQGFVKINPWQLGNKMTVDHYDYLLLRACIQTGYDIYEGCYHYRHGACKLPDEMIASLLFNSPSPEDLQNHWYSGTYEKKLEQIKGGNH